MCRKPSLFVVLGALVVLAACGAAVAGETTGTATNASASASSIYRNSPDTARILNGDLLPVLVRVNKHGEINYMAPAFDLRHQYRRLLRSTLAQMITKPARDKHGNAIASEFVIYITGKTTKRTDGKYDFRFTYVTARPVPFGNWIWAQYASGQLALMSPYDNGYYQYVREARRWRNLRNGSCYYDGREYGKCVIYCAQLKQCDTDKDKNSDKNNKDDDKSKATGNVIRAASTHVYRLQRPRMAARVRAPGARASGVYLRNAGPVGRFQPTTRQNAPSDAHSQRAPMPMRAYGGSGPQGNRAPAIVSRGANIP